MRLPKLPGFKNRNRVEYAVVNVSRLEELFADGDVVDCDSLVEKGVIKSASVPVKVLGDGELKKKLTVKADKVSGPAKVKIEAAGGTVEASC
jgi:large subunit ribosomal protein L15